MKHLKIVFLLLCSVTFLYSCKEEAEVPKEEINTQKEGTNSTDFLNAIAPSNAATPSNTAAPTQQTEPAQNAAGVWHYTCAKGCAGGAGTAINCTTCGSLLQHNQAYHGNTTDKPMTTTNTPPPTTTTPTPKAEPAQNAAGIWHYTCSKGCAGGSGTAEPCKSCGTLLAHNAAYH